MSAIQLPEKRRHTALCLFALVGALSLVLLTTTQALANSVTIQDQAQVLDQAKVENAAQALSYTVQIDTTNTFSGDQDALNSDAHNRLPDQNSIVIEIDTVQRHLSIQSGTNVPLTDDQASNAVEAFKDSFNGGDYTGATIAALNSLKDSLSGKDTSSQSSSSAWVAPCLIISVIVGFFGLLGLLFRGRSGGPPRGGGGRGWFGGVYTGSSWSSSSSSSSSSFGGGGGGSFGGGGGGGAGGSF